VDHGGRRGIEEVRADEVEPRFARDHALRLDRLLVRVEDGKVDPRPADVESRAPDDTEKSMGSSIRI
jgi:hypothetical protein